MTNSIRQLNIAIDYDDTFSAAPAFWATVIAIAESHNIRVYIVTCRRDTEGNRADIGTEQTGLPRHRHLFTGGAAKRWWCEQHGVKIDFWCDDMPETIFQGR